MSTAENLGCIASPPLPCFSATQPNLSALELPLVASLPFCCLKFWLAADLNSLSSESLVSFIAGHKFKVERWKAGMKVKKKKKKSFRVLEVRALNA